MSYKAPNPITKIKISGEPDCVPNDANEISFSAGANITLNTNFDDSTITISSLSVPESISDLSDVIIADPANGEALVYDAATGKWVNSSASSVVAADDIEVGDSEVLITTTSGDTTLSSQDGNVSINALNNVVVNSSNNTSVIASGSVQVQSGSAAGVNISAASGTVGVSAADNISIQTSGINSQILLEATEGSILIDADTTLDLVSEGSANLRSENAGILIDTQGATGKIIIDSSQDDVDIKSGLDMLLDSSEKFDIEAHKNINVESQTGDIQLTSTEGKAHFYAKDDLDITSDDGKVIIDGYLGIQIDSEEGGMDVNVSESINMTTSNDIGMTSSDDFTVIVGGDASISSAGSIQLFSSLDDVRIIGKQEVNLSTLIGDINVEPNANFNVLAGGSATINTNDNILLDSDALITLDANSFININAGNRIKLEAAQDIVLDSETGIWDFKEGGVSQLQITTSPDSQDLTFASTNPYGQVYFGIDTPYPVGGVANTKGLMIALRPYDEDIPPDEIVDGYVGMVGVNFQSGGPGNLLDILAERNDQGFQVSTIKSDGSGESRPLLRFAKENDEYGRLLIYKEDSTSAVDIGSRPGMRHYFHANGTTKFAIGTKSPNTLLHIANDTNPYITMQNLAVEHGDGQCETQLRFADHEENTLAYIEGSHDGAADDHKGKLRFLVNDGTDTWRDGIIIGHAGDVKKIGQSTPMEGDVLTWDNHNQRAIWSDSLDDGYIEELQDVDFGIAGPADGDALVYDAATETWVNSPISGGGGGGGLSLTTSTTDTLAFGNAMWATLAGNSAGLTNGVQWTTTISIPNGATVIDVIVDIGTAFDNMGSYDTIVTWQPGSDLFAFSGFYDSFGYFSSYYGSKILGNVGTATANGSWTNNSGGAQFLKLNFHHLLK